jgi:hypothetical protein
MGMVLRYGGRDYEAETATEIVLALARDSSASERADVRAYVERALARLADAVHPRERAIPRHVPEEAIAFNFLCLLDEYGIGRFSPSTSGAREP